MDIWNELKDVEEQEYLLYDTARIGYLDTYEVYVNTDDQGDTPHFHIWDRDSRGSAFHTCIKILSPEYLHHTGKENVLNTKQRKELCDFLKSPCTKNTRYKTNWEYLVSMWNDNNSSMIVPEDINMPDYTKLSQ